MFEIPKIGQKFNCILYIGMKAREPFEAIVTYVGKKYFTLRNEEARLEEDKEFVIEIETRERRARKGSGYKYASSLWIFDEEQQDDFMLCKERFELFHLLKDAFNPREQNQKVFTLKQLRYAALSLELRTSHDFFMPTKKRKLLPKPKRE